MLPYKIFILTSAGDQTLPEPSPGPDFSFEKNVHMLDACAFPLMLVSNELPAGVLPPSQYFPLASETACELSFD